jgi:Family of unknown function (DUF6428)
LNFLVKHIDIYQSQNPVRKEIIMTMLATPNTSSDTATANTATANTATANTATANTATAQGFLQELRSNLETPLMFTLPNGQTVPEGYHLTELKSVKVQAMDCGGQVDTWSETIIQLWSAPEGEAGRQMTGQKFLEITDQVLKVVPVNLDAKLKIEYGLGGEPAAHYQIGSLRLESGVLNANLEPLPVSCKARDRWNAEQQESLAPIGLEMIGDAGAACKPGGGCC